MASFSTISIRFNADLKQFSSQMQNAQRSMQKFGRQMTNVGKNLSIGLTAPIVALGYKSVEAFDKQAKAIAQVEAGLKSTGNAVGFTSSELQKMASELQNNSLFGDEEILQGTTAQLLTFTNIAGEQFARTQQASLDLATRLDGDLKSASIQLGKALNDPVANLSALSRSGIQFSEDQKQVINSLVASNRLADAQTIILDELEKQYGGAAAAAAKAGTGPLKQLSNILGDITEEFGAIIVEAILPFVQKIKEWAQAFQALSPRIKKIIVAVGAFAAAIGPVLVVLGTLSSTIIPALISGFTVLTGPIGLVIAALSAVGYVIYKYWEPIKQTLREFINYFIDLYNESLAFRVIVEGVILTFKNLWNVGKLVLNGIWTILETIGNNIKSIFSGLGKALKAILTGDFSSLGDIMRETFADTGKNFATMIKGFSEDIDTFKDDFNTSMQDSIDRIQQKKKLEIGILAEVEDVDTSKVEPVNIKANAEMQGRAQVTSVNTIETPDAVQMSNPLASLQGELAESSDFVMGKLDSIAEKMIFLQEVGARVGNEVGAAFENFTGRFVDSLGLASDGLQGFVGGLVQTITKLISMMLAQSISQSIAGATASGAATGPAAVFTTPSFIATAVSGVLAAFAAIPKFADGGIVSGPTLGLMGEYAGARNNPEVIAPLDKLRGMLKDSAAGDGGGFIAETKLRGQDLITVLSRANAYKNRRG